MNFVEPIKSKEKISAFRKILRSGANGVRNETLFVLGINSVFRVSDLLNLKVGDVAEDGELKETLVIKENKTGKIHQTALNESALKVLDEYLRELGGLKNLPADRLLFTSRHTTDTPISRQRLFQILKKAATEAGVENFGPHSLRKTFAYHVYKASANNIGLIQRLLNHCSPGVTKKYIGIDQEDMDTACLNLNLY
ncbi:MAG: tyrosine-type recombinase/integrase [Deltaproteobacteria bacterium]|jgi:integrase|nr:tyrosine-type recombinase/integrase [Deltaproteobacteria bacterium]